MNSKASERIEETIQEYPEVKSAKPPAFFGRFIEEFCPYLGIFESYTGLFGAYDHIDHQIDAVCKILQEDPEMSLNFQKMVKIIRKKDEDRLLEADVRSFGWRNVTEILLGKEILTRIYEKELLWDPSNYSPKIDLNLYLGFSKRVFDKLGEDNSFRDFAYLSALLYDILLAINENSKSSEKSAIKRIIENTFDHGVRTANIASKIAKITKNLELSQQIYGACLIHDIGKIIMVMQFPSYQKFQNNCLKKSISRNLSEIAEENFFGMSHTMFGYLACEYFKPMSGIKNAILYQTHPHLLKSTQEQAAYELASLVRLCTHIAEHYTEPSGENDPIMDQWMRPEIRELKISKSDLFEKMKELFAS